MRFCLLTTFYPPYNFGGDGIQVERLARALAELGHAVTVVHSPAAYRRLAGRDPVDAARPIPGVTVIGVDEEIGSIAPISSYLTGRPLLTRERLRRTLDEGFDVIHFHNPSLLGAPAVLGLGSGVKLYTAHEHWLVCPTHVLLRYGKEVCERPTCWRCTLAQRRPPQLWRSTGLLRRNLEHLDALIVLSRTSAELHRPLADVVRIERLANFADRPAEGPAWPDDVPRTQYFLFAGRLEPTKGVMSLLDTFRRRREMLVVAGTGTLEADLRHAATGHDNIRFLGWVGDDQRERLLHHARAVLLASIGHETFGLTAIEAFAHGTPVIARDLGAQAEPVRDAGAGFTYRSESELHDRLDRLATDARLRAELGQRGRSAYLERWTPQAHLRAYLALIADLAEGRGDASLTERATVAGRHPALWTETCAH